MNILHFPPSSHGDPLWIPVGASTTHRRRKPSLETWCALSGSRLLCIIDDDNLRISCRSQFSAGLSYRKLASHLQHLTYSCEMHAVLTSPSGDNTRSVYFEQRGYLPIDIKREVVETTRGPLVKGNADLDIAFNAGYRITTGDFDVLLVGSGDGDLVLSIARGVRRLAPSVRVYTLSVPHSSSSRILQHAAPQLIAGNFFVTDSLLQSDTPGGRSAHVGGCHNVS